MKHTTDDDLAWGGFVSQSRAVGWFSVILMKRNLTERVSADRRIDRREHRYGACNNLKGDKGTC